MIKSKRNIILLILSVLVCASLSLALIYGLSSKSTVKAQDIVLEEELKTEYLINESISIPKAKLGELDTNMIINFPSGVAKLTYDVELNEAGKYSVVYSLKNENELYTKVCEFNVVNPLVSFSGENSSSTYGTFYGNTGLKVSVAETESVLFNEPIDLSEFNANTPFLEFLSTPEMLNEVECKKIYIQLIDVKNPDNYVTIVNQATDEEYAYSLVGANGQSLTGKNGDVIHVNNEWGIGVYYRYYGDYVTYAGSLGGRWLQYYYDEEEKQFFVGNGAGAYFMIADLDSSEFFSNLWDGFDSNIVRIKIWCDNYYKNSANITVKTLGNVDLNSKTYKDTIAPEIIVNVDETNIPLAKVDAKYKIFEASAVDNLDLDCKVETRVYYEYKNKQVNVSLENGYFVPNEDGTFYIEYTCTDRAGNTSTRTVSVEARSTGVYAPVIATLSRVITANVGEEVPIADYVLSGGSGELKVETTVYLLGEKIAISKENTFKPLKEGIYTVLMNVTDYLEQSSAVYYSVDVKFSDKPIFGEIILPRYLISGSNYKFDEVYAIDYKNGGTEVLAEVSVEDKNGVKNIAYTETYAPAVENNLDYVKVNFNANGAVKTIEIPCILGSEYNNITGFNEINLKNYFVGDVEVTPQGKNVLIAATNANSSWTFANKLIAKDLSVAFSGADASTSFDGLKITVEDSLNSDYAIEMILMKNSTTTTAIVGARYTNVNFAWSESEVLSVNLTDESIMFGASKLPYATYINGEEFNGFPSNFVYVTCEFINATAGAKYCVNTVNEQLVSSNKEDFLAPKIVLLDNRVGGSCLPGDTIIVAPIATGDVISGNVIAEVNVYDADFNYITATDGTLLKAADPTKGYEIVLNDIGRYYIKYSSKDENGRVSEYSVSVRVLDTVAPKIEMGSITKKGTVGEAFSVADFEATDNYDAVEDMDIYCIVVAPNGKKQVVSVGGSYTPTVAGQYTVTCLVADTTGNVTTVSYYVSVE